MRTLLIVLAALALNAGCYAGNVLTQSLEHETDRGTVADQQPSPAGPTPAPLKRTMSDKDAKKRVHIHRKGQRPPPRPSPVPQP